MRIIGYISENNWKNFQAVQKRIIGKKLSIIASCLITTCTFTIPTTIHMSPDVIREWFSF